MFFASSFSLLLSSTSFFDIFSRLTSTCRFGFVVADTRSAVAAAAATTTTTLMEAAAALFANKTHSKHFLSKLFFQHKVFGVKEHLQNLLLYFTLN